MSVCTIWPRSAGPSPGSIASRLSAPSLWRAKARNGQAAWSARTAVPPRTAATPTGGARRSERASQALLSWPAANRASRRPSKAGTRSDSTATTA